MTLLEIKNLLTAEILCGENCLSEEAEFVFSSDMMSDVLAFGEGHSVLVTGLCNPQVVRTAEMMDISCIIFASEKQPNEQIQKLAEEKCIAVLTTSLPIFTTCGILYENGLRGIS